MRGSKHPSSRGTTTISIGTYERILAKASQAANQVRSQIIGVPTLAGALGAGPLNAVSTISISSLRSSRI